MNKLKIVMTIVFLVCITLFLPNTFAKTLYVDDDGSQPYLKIKNAVYFAEDGDTVYVYRGTYTNEDIIIDKKINLIGEDKFSTIINGNSKMTVKGNGAYIYNFTISLTERIKKVGTGVYLEGDNNILNHCIIKYYRMGVVLEGSNNIIKNCTIYGNLWGLAVNDEFRDSIPTHNHIYHNNFIDNDGNAIIFYSGYSSYKQFWNTSTEGNYWDDYDGPDANRDGIGEIPYTIKSAESAPTEKDYFPFYSMIDLGTPEENNNKENDVPAFELTLVIIAIAVIFYMKNKI